MAHLALSLLGSFQARLDRLPLNGFESDKARALLAYLAVEGSQPQPRETLAGLLWPDFPQENAQANLRDVISKLRKLLGDRDAARPFLFVTREAVGLNPQSDFALDLAEFECLVDPHSRIRPPYPAKPEGSLPAGLKSLMAAVDLWRGPFLEGLSLPDCPEFDDWVLIRREQLNRLAMKALREISAGLADLGQFEMALPYAWRQVSLEPWQEEAHQQVMRLLALNGQRTNALAHFEQCRKTLQAELGVEPGAETVALAEAIRRGDLAGIKETSLASITPVTLELVPPEPGLPPFKGLQFFDEADAGIFFGRQVLTARLVGHISEMGAGRSSAGLENKECLLAVVGASGSGKSSVVRAGLVPVLKGITSLPDVQPPPGSNGWRFHILTPTAHPLESLADGLGREAGPAAKRLLVIDQFEELFTLCRSEDERAAFLDSLMRASATGEVLVVIVLRADFYAHCARYPRLREALSARQVFIGPMSAAELRQAIEEPARLGGWEFAPGLVDLFLRDVGASEGHPPEPGALPLLEHALLETWARRRGRTLTLQGYADAGGVQGAIAHTAESVLHRLTAEQQALARRIFLRLTELGEGTQDTCRRAAISELVSKEEEAPEVESLLQELADARLITLSEGIAEVAHEALIREWPSLRAWLSESRESLRLHRRLTAAAQDWENLARDSGALYRGAPLAQALEWTTQPGHASELNALEQEFLLASQAQAEGEARQREDQRQHELEAAQAMAESAQKLTASERKNAEVQRQAAQRLRRRALYLAGLAVLAVALMAAAVLIAIAANRNAQQATARQNASAALADLTTDPGKSISLALQSVQDEPSADAFSALHRAVFANHMRSRLAAHQGWVYGMAVNPGGDRLATIGTDRVLKVWQLEGSTIQQPSQLVVPDIGDDRDQLFTRNGFFFNPLQFSPDGKYLVTVNHLNEIVLVDSFSGVVAGRVDLADQAVSPIYHLDFAPKSPGANRYRVAASSGDRIWIIEMGSGRNFVLGSRSVNAGWGFSFAFRPDGTLITGGWDWNEDGEVNLWDLTYQEDSLVWHQSSLAKEAGAPIFYISASPDGSQVAYTTSSEAHILDLTPLASGGQPVEQLTIPLESEISFYATRIFYLPGGDRLARADWRGRVLIYDAKTGLPLFSPVEPEKGVMVTAAVSPVNQAFFSGHSSGEICSWDVAAPGSAEWVGVPTGAVRGGVILSQNGADLLTWDITNASLGQWQFARWRIDSQQAFRLGSFTTETSPSALNYIFSFGQSFVVLGDNEGGAGRIQNALTGELIQALSPDSWISDLAISPDGSRIYFAYPSGLVYTWDVAARKKLANFWVAPATAASEPYNINLSTDGTLLITYGALTPGVKLWNVATGQLMREFKADQNNSCDPVLTPDNRFLVTSGPNFTALVWDVATGEQVRTIQLIASAQSISLSPDARYLAIALCESQTYVFNFATGSLLYVLPGAANWAPGYPGAIPSQFSPDSRHILITFPRDHAAYGFILDKDELVKLACERLAAITLPGEESVIPSICKNP